MTRYTVIWATDALNQLAQLWMDAVYDPTINAAANAIDRELARDPETKGSSLSEGMRFLEIPPLHVLFTVTELDRMVRVVLVRASAFKATPQDGNGQAKN